MMNNLAPLNSDKSLLQLTRENPKQFDQTTWQDGRGTKYLLQDTGILKITPKDYSNQDIVISSGVHGNETAPIEIVDQLVREIVSGSLIPKNRVLFIIGNPIAMNLSQRFDKENLNRLFNGKHQDLTHHEAQRARLLESAVEDFFSSRQDVQRYHFDLHTAIRASKYKKFAVYPYPDGKPWNKTMLSFFAASDINTILLGHQPSGTFSYFSSHQFDAHAFTVELGKVKPFGENDMTEFAAITENLRCLIQDQPVPLKSFNNDELNLFQVKDEVIRKSEDEFCLHLDEKVENFTDFDQGYQLTTDIDGGYKIKESRDAIVFPNSKIPVGQRVGLVVSKTRI